MELIKLLPEYYDENVTMQTLQSILSKETDDLETGLSDTISECFASTASVLLSRYENLLGLTIDVTKENDYRRKNLCKACWNGNHNEGNDRKCFKKLFKRRGGGNRG